MTSDELEKFAAWTMKQYLLLGGSFVSEEQYAARLGVCAGCPRKGMVSVPVPVVSGLTLRAAEMRGCTVCGCPFATKPRVREYRGISGMKTVECPEGKWRTVDSQFTKE
jgi:hypothetical protein